MYRFYTPHILAPNNIIKLDEDELHHLHVVRKKYGETIELINGQGMLASAKFEQDGCVITSVKVFPRIEKLWIVLPRLLCNKDMCFTVEKLCEIGVKGIYIWVADRDKKSYFDYKFLDKVYKRMINAIKQSNRYWVPSLSVLDNLECLEEKTNTATLLFGSLLDDACTVSVWGPMSRKANDVWFVSGPESGFSDREERLLRQINGLPVSLGDFVLRAENAPIVFAAMTLSWIGI